jgi:hypothetical protein
VNAAFLLVTSACLLGQTADKKETIAPPGGPAPIVASNACGPTCAASCGCEGQRFKDRLRGLFHRECDTCNTCAPAPAPACAPKASCSSCDTGCRARLFNFGCHEHSAPACNTCDTCGESSFLTRLRGIFARRHHCDSCSSCGTGCASGACANGACAPSTIAPPSMGEKIEAPKKMPPAPTKTVPPAKQEVRIETQPQPVPPIAAPPAAIPSVPAAPSVELAPSGPAAPPLAAPAPRIDGDRRDPF